MPQQRQAAGGRFTGARHGFVALADAAGGPAARIGGAACSPPGGRAAAAAQLAPSAFAPVVSSVQGVDLDQLLDMSTDELVEMFAARQRRRCAFVSV